MSLLAAIIDWDNPGPPVESLGALFAPLPNHSPDGRFFGRVPNVLLGLGSRVVRAIERGQSQPIRDKRRGLFAVGDLRIDNRDELKESLNNSAAPLDSDLAVVMATYERWGEATAARLVGDFAFILWDERRREVYAARDHFGVRSLVYDWKPSRLIVATEPAQMLGLPDFDRSPNPQIVVDFLSWSYGHYGPTFFRSVRSLRPGHYLHVRAGSLREVEYFQPPQELLRYPRAEDYREQFRAVFRRSVLDRVDSTYPIVAHLSGGLDSSSIVCTADGIYGEPTADDRPPFHLGSATYGDQPYDETPFIDEVTRAVRFSSHRWDGNQPNGKALSRPSLSIPGASVTFNSGSTGDVELASRLGARVILSGDPGDFVTGEFGLFNDLLIKRQWLTLCRQVLAATSEKERRIRWSLVRRAVREEVPPGLLGLWRTLRGRTIVPSVPPRWLKHDLSVFWNGPESRDPPLLRVGINRLQQRTWDYLRWSRSGWLVDLFGTYAALAGAEARFPLLDVRLVRFMLSIPVEHRLLGRLRRALHRDSIAGIVPERIAFRPTKPVFSGAVIRWGHACLPAIREILEGPQWESEPFVDRGEARRVLETLASRPADRGDREAWLGLRAIVNLETWLRGVFRYPRTQETLPMLEIRSASEEESASAASSSAEDAYLPPKVVSVGNVRDLLAATGPSGDDTINPAPSLGDP